MITEVKFTTTQKYQCPMFLKMMLWVASKLELIFQENASSLFVHMFQSPRAHSELNTTKYHIQSS